MEDLDIREAEKALREQENQIRFNIKPFRVADLVYKFKKDQFYIPDYQREDVWSDSMKSKFIESVLLGLPIPDIFVSQTKADEDYSQVAQYEIIDGSQRIRTLVSFVNCEFTLKKLKSVQELNDFKYCDLTQYRQDQFNDVTIDIIILDSDTSEDVKNTMFDRINTHNPLKSMELRRGSYNGAFNKLIRECGIILEEDYQDICSIHQHWKKRREEEELALRFFAFSETFEDDLIFQDMKGEKVSKYNESTENFLTLFYDYQNQRLKQIEKDNKIAYRKELDRLKTNFTTMLKFVEKNFKYGFKREKSKSVARVVFEAISVGVHLAIQETPAIVNKKIITSWIHKKTFKDSINQKYHLHDPKKIVERIEIVKNSILNNIINE